MDDSPRSDPTMGPSEPVRKRTGKGILWGVLAVALAFSAGFLWQFSEARAARGNLAAAEQELAMERLRGRLGQAALAANRGNYEAARQQMSTLFDRFQDTSPTLPPAVRGVASDLLERRDDVITGLSRGNPEYADVLHGMLEALSNAIDRSLGVGAEGAMAPGDGTVDGSAPPGEAAPAGGTTGPPADTTR